LKPTLGQNDYNPHKISSLVKEKSYAQLGGNSKSEVSTRNGNPLSLVIEMNFNLELKQLHDKDSYSVSDVL
jgi:hypothetical protein